MKKFISISLAVISCFFFLVGTERRALAYVDPGTGLLAIQTIGSALAAAAYFLRRRITALFRSKDATTAAATGPVAIESDRKAA